VTPKLVFIISIPRSGSTLLQKILMSHSNIASHPEPWFLLPLVYMHRDSGIQTEYGHKQSINALKNILKNLPNGINDYHQSLRMFAFSVYSKLSNQKKYFLDKTPRYYFIIPEVFKLFPEAKFIILVRNPISIFSSCIEAFKKNSSRRLDSLDRDIFDGPKYISQGAKLLGTNSIIVSYEDLVVKTEIILRRISDFLDLEYEEDMVKKSFLQKLDGHGDHLGAKKFKYIKNQQNKWRIIINSSYRKYRLKKYIEKIDDNYLDLGNYKRKELLRTVNAHKVIEKNKFDWLWYIEEYIVRIIKKTIRHQTLS